MQYEGTDLTAILAEREAELNRREAELRRIEQEVARLEALRVEMLRVAAQLDMREASLAARTHVRAPEPEPLQEQEPLIEPPLSPPLKGPVEKPSDSWEESWWEHRLGQPLSTDKTAAAA
jgi:hypothetical protein